MLIEATIVFRHALPKATSPWVSAEDFGELQWIMSQTKPGASEDALFAGPYASAKNRFNIAPFMKDADHIKSVLQTLDRRSDSPERAS